jgi:hypothetical protein
MTSILYGQTHYADFHRRADGLVDASLHADRNRVVARGSPADIAQLTARWLMAVKGRPGNDRLAGKLAGRPDLELPGRTLAELAG